MKASNCPYCFATADSTYTPVSALSRCVKLEVLRRSLWKCYRNDSRFDCFDDSLFGLVLDSVIFSYTSGIIKTYDLPSIFVDSLLNLKSLI